MWGTIKRALKFQREDPCGVGIVFTEMEDGSLVVTGLLPNCPAELSQIVAMGDTLYEVDGVNYYRAEKSKVAAAVLGPEGSVVQLGLKRGLRYESDPVYHVALVRAQVPNAGQVAKLRMKPAAA